MNAGRQPTATESSWAVKNIFRSLFSRVKPFSRRGDRPPPAHGVPAGRGVKWALLLVLIPVSLAFLAAIERGNPATSKAIRRKIIAALQDPLNLLDERSPGGRGSRILLSIKGPHERVLSTVREREPPLDITPAVADPIVAAAPEAVASIPIVPPEFETRPQNQTAGLPLPSPFFPDVPPVFLSPTSTPSPPNIPVGTPAPPPGSPGNPSNPGTIIIPEPASWAMMILGLLAIGAAVRRRARK
jgi:hypothetical protein